MDGTHAPRMPHSTAARTEVRTRAGRQLSVGHVQPVAGGPGRVVLEVVQHLDERGGVLSAGLTPEEARRLADGLLAQALAAENPTSADAA